MTTICVFFAGAAYAGCLWFIAAQVARRRFLTLGYLPWWVIMVCACAAVSVGTFVPPNIAPLAAASLIGAIICALVDARTGFIFDALSLTMLSVACILALLEGRFTDGAIAAVVVGGALAALYLLSGRRGIGLGDVKLGCIIALGYGLESAIVAIGSAFVLGAVYAGILIGLRRAKRSDALRFGPFIAGGAVVGLTAGTLGWPW